MNGTVFYAIIAPKWRAPFRPVPGLGTRPRLRWQIVRETRPVVHGNGIVVSGWEHISYHWTYRAAARAQGRLT